MNRQFPSRIFKSNLRGCEETPSYKCLSTFNFKKYQDETRSPFGQLAFLNDEYLAPQSNITYSHKDATNILLLPIVGTIGYEDSASKNELIKSEQIRTFEAKTGDAYMLQNPNEKEWINYLHIGFKMNDQLRQQKPIVGDVAFEKLNQLVSLNFKKILQSQPAGYIGIYQSRKKENYKLHNLKNGLFIYVINGVFDVHGRLLESRDGLSLYDTPQIEFEALTDNAIIILLETNLNSNVPNINNN